MSFKLSELADKTKSTLIGDGDCLITNIADLSSAGPGDIAFLFNPGFVQYLENTRASAVILKSEFRDLCHVPALVTEDPRLVYAKIANILNPPEKIPAGIADSAIIADDADVDKTSSIAEGAIILSNVVIKAGAIVGPGCVVEKNVVIGSNTKLSSNVTVGYDCIIGDDCIIHSGAVIGADGFGFVKDDETYLKIPQLGSVIIGNKVEIGANTTIDRGALEDTVIGNGVKLDNQIQIAHGVTIGENSVISAATAIAGSTHIGKQCLIGGCVGIIEHLDITDNVMITGRTMVTRSITEPGSYSSSTPMDTTENWRKNSARFRRLDELAKRVAKLEKNSKQ
jgi:UDP-3-O-[3-hydroxymyristoyl] glucosamine N-acyltransferase